MFATAILGPSATDARRNNIQNSCVVSATNEIELGKRPFALENLVVSVFRQTDVTKRSF